jgi:hypothetical protein
MSKAFAVVVPSERHAEHWSNEYAPMFEMMGATYIKQQRTWQLPLGGRVCVCIIRGVRDVDKMRGMSWCGFSRGEIFDSDVIDAIRPLIRP